MKNLNSKVLFRFFIYILPLVLFFSYYPLIHFGESGSMNFEISLTLIWLVLFDVLAFAMMVKRKMLLRSFKKNWIWLLFPAFLTVSVLWSFNSLRGLLTAGIIWLLYFAGYAIFSFRNLFNEEFKWVFWKWFFGSALFACFWCFLQCFLDLAGVGREWTLMCEGCIYSAFGFPHPNGFSIEPQFMGNLLLAPAVVSAWMFLEKKDVKRMVPCFLMISATLFLTFSRGAIYAFTVAMVFMTGLLIVREKGKILKRLGAMWLMLILAFLFILNLQGVMAKISPTKDTYFSGVTKALNHLSLGMIDIREEDVESKREQILELEKVPVENFVENEKKESLFDGYVVESTETRVKLTSAAMTIWVKNPETIFIGVGLGGAGQALYVNGLTDSPKEIIQNQYASLLLETGLIGVVLAILTLVLAIRVVIKNSGVLMILSLMVAYGVSLLFFSGLPNALQIYLLPVVLMVFCEKNQRGLRKKLVS